MLHSFQAMGSPCRIRVDGAWAAGRQAQRAVAAAQAEVRRIEQRYSRYRAQSVVSRINAAAGTPERLKLDAETAGLLHFAQQLHASSGGLFDLTSGVLRRVWDFKAHQPPTPEALAGVLPLVGWHLVEFDGASLRLPRAGMELDLGGIGKEYAAAQWRALAAGHHPPAPRRRGDRHPGFGPRRPGHQRGLRALFAPPRPALLPHPQPA
jgi:thiamine biosynthesis lipoprotein